MAEVEPGQDPVGEDPRIASLEERIERAEQIEKIRTGERDEKADENTRLGNRVLAELIGGLAGGALVGWVLDRFLGTQPWLLLVFLFLGIIVAFRNIYRISMQRPKE
ncbi:MAG: AtpZ/AtpI family protein [Sphingobium sp.]|nr:AtpZ/AtpI family protein [Sphingobium sp.]MCP5398513.1 AtpZ/AtpI family protein [Sphingomonas sp.]